MRTYISIAALLFAPIFLIAQNNVWIPLGPDAANQPCGPGEGFVNMCIDETGNIYVAHREWDEAGIATSQTVRKYTGASWQIIGDPAFTSSVNFPAIAVSPNGNPHLLYDDGSYGGGTVRKFDGNDWVLVGQSEFYSDTVMFDGADITISNNGNIYTAFSGRFGGGTWNARLKPLTVMTFNGSTWETVGGPIASDGMAAVGKIEVSNDGTIFVAYTEPENNFNIAVRRFNGSTWENVGGSGFCSGRYVSLAITSSNQPCIAYRDSDNNDKLTVKLFNGNDWETLGTSGFSYSFIYEVSLAINSNDVPYVAFPDGGGNLRAMSFNGVAWEDVSSESIDVSWGDHPVLDFLPNGIPVVAYSSGSNHGRLTVKKLENNQWNYVGSLGFSEWLIETPSIAVDSIGTPYVAYKDWGGIGGEISVKKFEDSLWSYVGEQSFSDSTVRYTRIALNNDGTPYVSYLDYAHGSRITVKKFNGTSWVNVGPPGFSNGEVGHPDIAISNNGTPYVVFQDDSDNLRANVMTFDGNAWSYLGGSSNSASSAYQSRIAIDQNGAVYVVYSDWGNGRKLSVIKYDGSWSTVGSPLFSDGEAYEPDIVIDNEGYPIVVYSDYGNDEKATVKKFNGSAWVTIGTEGFTPASARNTAIGLDYQDRLYIVYQKYDYHFGNYPGVMTFNNGAWENLGENNFVHSLGTACDIAVTPSGTPIITFKSGGAWAYRFNRCPQNAVNVNGIELTAVTPGSTYQWFDCGNGFQPIEGANQQTFTGEDWGEYQVEITDNNCTVLTGCYVAVGIEEFDSAQINIYPNPSRGNFRVNLPEGSQSVRLEVFNSTGKLIESLATGLSKNSSVSVDISNQPAGIYMIRLQLDGNITSKKVVLSE